VGALGDILVLAHDASERARPATLTVTEWTHSARSSAAFERFMAARHGSSYAVTQAVAGEGATPAESRWTTTLAFESPTRFRESSAGTQAGLRYFVRDGDRWLSWDADWGGASDETEGEGRPTPTYAFLLDPLALVSGLRLEPAGTTEVGGRAAWHVRATPRDDPEGPGASHRLGLGADAYELALDVERGVLLRGEALLDGKPFHRLEVSDIAFGPIDPRTFAVAVPEGAEAPTGWSRPLRLPLHELAAATPFQVYVPADVPEGWRLVERLLTPAREKPRVAPSVSLVYASREGAYVVSIHEREAETEHRDSLAWQRDGYLEVADAGEHVEPRHHVRVAREGTVVELSGADPELLADLARSLVPAPTEPPRLAP
jgi:hypothetical protein